MEFAYITSSSYCSTVQWLHSLHSFVQCFSLCDDAVSRSSFERTSCYYHPDYTQRIFKCLMKSEDCMNLSMTFWFISCLLCIQNLVYFSSFTTKLYSLCFFYYCYYWLALVRTLFNLLSIWHLCRPLYSCPIEFFISSFMSLFAAAHTNLQLLSEKLTHRVHRQR